MKLAILSDIHGNLSALHAVAEHLEHWKPDQVIVNGDIINRGPCSLATWEFCQQKVDQDGWILLKGNHEDYLLERLSGNDIRQGVEFDLNYLSYWTYLQMGTAVSQLSYLADEHTIIPHPNRDLRIRHGSMLSNRDWLGPYTPEEQIKTKIAPLPHIYACAHTHIPFLRTIDHCRLINSGGVGASSDGDPRASYVQLFWYHGEWHISFIRLDYDREKTKRQFYTSGFLTNSGFISWLIYYEWQFAVDLVFPWQFQYQADVLQGKISLETAVTQYLHKIGLSVPKPHLT